ncbi:phage head closure protein [Neobacillus niacini]|uniref:phage head closure protein n=1 Tax=Neobacillus niacini TaxID=86668 RepID=UPI002FFFB530
MLFRDMIDLLEMEEGINENGFSALIEVGREVIFANKKGIRGNEFYLASQNGYKLELMLVIRSSDYKDQRYLEFESKQYEIVRTYDKGEFIELICQVFVP